MNDKHAAIAGSSSTVRIFRTLLADRVSRLSFASAIMRFLWSPKNQPEADKELIDLLAS